MKKDIERMTKEKEKELNKIPTGFGQAASFNAETSSTSQEAEELKQMLLDHERKEKWLHDQLMDFEKAKEFKRSFINMYSHHNKHKVEGKLYHHGHPVLEDDASEG